MLALILTIVLAVIIFNRMPRGEEPLQYSDVRAKFIEEQVREFEIVGNNLTLQVQRPDEPEGELTEYIYELLSFNLFFEDLHPIVVTQVEAD